MLTIPSELLAIDYNTLFNNNTIQNQLDVPFNGVHSLPDVIVTSTIKRKKETTTTWYWWILLLIPIYFILKEKRK